MDQVDPSKKYKMLTDKQTNGHSHKILNFNGMSEFKKMVDHDVEIYSI